MTVYFKNYELVWW